MALDRSQRRPRTTSEIDDGDCRLPNECAGDRSQHVGVARGEGAFCLPAFAAGVAFLAVCFLAVCFLAAGAAGFLAGGVAFLAGGVAFLAGRFAALAAFLGAPGGRVASGGVTTAS